MKTSERLVVSGEGVVVRLSPFLVLFITTLETPPVITLLPFPEISFLLYSVVS